MAEWRRRTIGDLCDAGEVELQTGPFGSQLHAHDYVEEGVPVVPTEAIRSRQIDRSVLPKIRRTKAEELRRHRLEPGDILFARRGVQATGHIGYVRDAEDGFICGTGAIRLRVNKGKSEVAPDFLSHVLANPESVEWFKFHAIGATMPNLNEGIIRSFPLCIPPLPEQRAIAHILGTLDDKIELNRRMNETLEAMARALFQSWFVDFDPVRAKGEGRDPGLPKEIVDLFPDRFEDSELGKIPAGWGVGTILEQATLLSGGTPKTERVEYWDGGIPWASAKDVSQCSQALLVATERTITAKGLEESATQLIPALSTVVVARGATTGRMVLLGRDMAMNQTCYALKSTTGTPFALHCRLRREIDALVYAAHGSVFDTITTNTFLASKVVVVPPVVLSSFEQQISPVFQRILKGIEECGSLAALRDTLLPKLISGELRVQDAQRFVGGVDSMDEVDGGRA